MVNSILVPENSTHFKRRLAHMPHLFNHSILTPNNADANFLQTKPIIFPSELSPCDDAILGLWLVQCRCAILASFAMFSHWNISSLVASRDLGKLPGMFPVLSTDYVLQAGFWVGRKQAITLLQNVETYDESGCCFPTWIEGKFEQNAFHWSGADFWIFLFLNKWNTYEYLTMIWSLCLVKLIYVKNKFLFWKPE